MGTIRSTTAKLVPTKYVISKDEKSWRIENLDKYIVNIESILTVLGDALTLGILTPCIEILKNGEKDDFSLETGFQKYLLEDVGSRLLEEKNVFGSENYLGRYDFPSTCIHCLKRPSSSPSLDKSLQISIITVALTL